MFGWDDAAAAVLKIVDKVIPDPQAKAQAAFQLAQMRDTQEARDLDAQLKQQQMQVDINKIEATSDSKFKSWPRPFVMWVCGGAFAYSTVLEPIMRFIATVFYGYTGTYPVIDTAITFQLLIMLLGLGTMRTTEKIKGAA